MKILALVRSELQRLTSTPLARLALVALMCVPLLYGGLYLWANQDPYANLDKVPAALVNQDQGTTIDGKATNYGDRVTDQIVDGKDFEWHVVSAKEASAGLRDQTYDFSFTIPSDFSADLTSADTSDPRRAQIVLATSDVNGYLSSTIAEQAGKTIRASVTEQVGKEAASRLLVGLADIRTNLGSAVDGANQLVAGAGSAVAGANQLSTGASDAATGAHTLADGTSQLSSGASSLNTGLQQLKTSTTNLPTQAATLASGAAQVADGNKQLADGVSSAAATSAAAAAALPAQQQEARAQIRAALQSQGYTDEQIANLEATFQPVTDSLTGALTNANTQIQGLNGQVSALSTGAAQVSAGAAQLSASAPALTDGISKAAAGSATLSSGAASAASGASSLASGLDTLSTGTTTLRDGLVTLDDGTTTLRDGLQSGLGEIPVSTASQRDDQAGAISDPVAVKDQALTSAGTYGAGLAPFFISLAAWIGMYALFLIIKPISKRAITAVKAPVRISLAGWLAPALLGVVQMIALYAIVTNALGFGVVHPWGLVGMMALASVAFAAIIMTLNVWLGSVGQFLGLVLMVVQLVTAGGTFPWQTLPGPLAALHFALPMSYATDGIRQLMYGGSPSAAWADAGVLAAWLVGALLLSLLAATRMTRRRTLRDLRPSLIG
ncbi:YhgE/Pip family protein [Frigoribacterium sp. 2-23]|uniref:YhgE/Pip family protein n=1 Tax=Frigoribacterium sp. 2-23 TaxID=3415006 RepID=UPI003C6FB1D7